MFDQSISAVTICVGYGDFLKETAPWNFGHFNRWTVVTTPEDTETREVCRRYSLHCLVTEDARRDGDFSKGRMIERGLQHGNANGWMLHLDADIALPSTFRRSLMRAHLEPTCIYGSDRVMVQSWDQWKKLQDNGWMDGNYHGFPHGTNFPQGFEAGARWAGADGYVPIGFFQLWNRGEGGEEWRGYRTKSYPTQHGTACRTDVQFGLQWDRRERVLLPELIVAHLESQKAATGANWKGRTTMRFGPKSNG